MHTYKTIFTFAINKQTKPISVNNKDMYSYYLEYLLNHKFCVKIIFLKQIGNKCVNTPQIVSTFCHATNAKLCIFYWDFM